MEMEITFPGGARVDAAFGDHVVRTDQPVESGGEGSAPAPFDYFLASIGTCAGIYMLNFCRHRGIPTEDIRIHQRVVFDADTGRVDTIYLDIYLPPDFPPKYSRAMINSAALCSVKRELEDPPNFEINAHIKEG